ncbi:unnamed protein product [Rotaria socialis]|uniref:K Homology domain-containing protein n=2 Tax=Rotaria socialis TaxID=392032 RepID=A0A820P597_9BILA|nr:unnamed protein product [Rotaria socialis]CAF4401237.1 unnamed protein product [Rotaria socialis]
MDTTTKSSSGYIIEFNRDTGLGLIQDDTKKQVLLVKFNSFKKRSRRYLTNDNDFLGELFDFDIIAKQNSDNDGIDKFEAVNVTHRVLKCNVEGCSRIKAFTNVKAFENHINIKHILRKKKDEETSQSSAIVTKNSKKVRGPHPASIVINLSSSSTTATIGKFIGKHGANLKPFQQKNQVKLQLIDAGKVYSPLQIRIQPNVGVKVDIKSVIKKLKAKWEQCLQEHEAYKKILAERFKLKHTSSDRIIVEFESDPRYRTDFKFLRINRLKRQELLQRTRYRQTESSVRVQERHSTINQEGHRSEATCDGQYRQKSSFNYSQPKKVKKSMKEKHWLLNEQLEDLE